MAVRGGKRCNVPKKGINLGNENRIDIFKEKYDRVKLDSEMLLLVIKRSEEPQVNLLLALADKTEFDKLVNMGDEEYARFASIFEELLSNNFYPAASRLLDFKLPNTIKRLKEVDYLDRIDQMIASEPRRFDFSVSNTKKRTLPVYSKSELIKLKSKSQSRLVS